MSAPPSDVAAETPCTKLLTALPVALDDLQGRPVDSTSPYVKAWGEPPIVLRCGVPRPAGLAPASAALIFQTTGAQGGTVNWLPVSQKKRNIFTTVDRAVYVEVTVPTAYRQPPVALLSDAIAKVLPPVCQIQVQGQQPPPESKACTHRR